MTELTPSYDRLLARIEERSEALRKAAAAADPGARVPSCPDWSLRDLVVHLGEVQRFWATVVASGPDFTPRRRDGDDSGPGAGELLAWAEESTRILVGALRAAGPEDGCWTWWGGSKAPQTVGAVARHQVQEAAVHAFDAQLAAGLPEAVPADVALDGIAEFLDVSHGTAVAWPHAPGEIRLRTAEGPEWELGLPEGAGDPGRAATLRGAASDLLLVLHRRLPVDRIRVEGDASLATDLLTWPDLS
ncbi:hypothetical protein SRB5_49870 [Streptomyces sp. RB5]|uniref:Maleylpyruvate isomerase family mycothiol-dependent enzyme n=1 Tax=Streptomyces smaragdinus TaxID=2585196 RepID=A0A7K0CN22_9ACTN|nr:maleylpyruvate isomerase family mycothiol-dependent enzyme [Streptomyces smaragdinus]MQY14811.1 hypothetical protein [Streptomyces smaragdinus]